MIRAVVVVADAFLTGIVLLLGFVAIQTYFAGYPDQALALIAAMFFVGSAISPPPRPQLTARLEYMPGATR